jgi:hypothetical protein
MAIDKNRLKAFEADLLSILDELGFDDFWEIYETKLLDYAARIVDDISKPGIRDLKRETKRLFNPEIRDYTTKIFNSFGNVVDLVNTYYSEFGSNISRDITRLQSIERVTATRLGDYEKRIANDIANQIRKDLATGSNFKKVAKNISGFSDRVNFYAETISRTQVKGYSRGGKEGKAKLAEVNFFEYVGIIQNNTRPFCRVLVGKTHHIKDIKRMRNGNLSPVITYCGGWRCQHDWEPDPFANESSGGTLQEIGDGKNKVLIFAPGRS